MKTKNLEQILPPDAYEVVKARGFIVSDSPNPRSQKKRYTKYHLQINHGYDLLQYMGTVRRYLMERYNISYDILEMIWLMAPYNHFTEPDYVALNPPTKTIRISRMVKRGLINEVTLGHWKTKKLFTLSHLARSINTVSYEYLSGEKKMPTRYELTPIKKNAKVDKVVKHTLSIIEKLNKMPVPDSKKNF